MSRLYCSDEARQRGDDNIATAARIDVWILVELPITWGIEPIVDAAFPSFVRKALTDASHIIPRSRVVFIRKRVECLGPTRVYIVRSHPRVSVRRIDLQSIDEVAQLDFVELSTQHAEPKQPIVLVCTHGQHDSCCGRRGYPLFDALQRNQELDVWQCSHIGGDRFAANAVVLPWGLYYGPVEVRDADALTASIARNEIFLPSYRGRCSVPRPVQAAETFVRREQNLLGRDALHFVSRENHVDGRMRIQLRDAAGTLHDVTIEHYVVAEEARLTCTAKTASPIRQFRLVNYSTSDPS